ncbi:MAG TPA: hypothetical protein VFV66_22480 [Nonomuraea sp.]|nr:hypothetical protein [Nonomuraea sp.]
MSVTTAVSTWLTRGELEKMISEFRRVILPLLTNQPTPDRTQHLLSPIIFPVELPPADSE